MIQTKERTRRILNTTVDSEEEKINISKNEARGDRALTARSAERSQDGQAAYSLPGKENCHAELQLKLKSDAKDTLYPAPIANDFSRGFLDEDEYGNISHIRIQSHLMITSVTEILDFSQTLSCSFLLLSFHT
jgi:hypothetical protein